MNDKMKWTSPVSTPSLAPGICHIRYDKIRHFSTLVSDSALFRLFPRRALCHLAQSLPNPSALASTNPSTPVPATVPATSLKWHTPPDTPLPHALIERACPGLPPRLLGLRRRQRPPGLFLDLGVQAVAVRVHGHDRREVQHPQVPHRLGNAQFHQLHAQHLFHR